MKVIRFLRENVGLTQMQLADKMHVGQSAVAMWESGESMPRADKLPELAKILKCSVDDLYGAGKKENRSRREQLRDI